ncbi:MAG: pyridinium-3,5-biscarboxylic acid mononucleotide synthase [Desulfovibrionales bacterium]|jgi:NCAIR mutase (PurE)-related protein|nr:pyridinium-3,5-biscarboxylic acid mononucleotide synthase [Desulfovibrionales bacterium]
MTSLDSLLEAFRKGRIDAEDLKRRLTGESILKAGFSRLDNQRLLRRGLPETIYCKDKTPDQVREIVLAMSRAGQPVLGTKAGPEHAQAVADVEGLSYNPVSQLLTVPAGKCEPTGKVAVLSAGAADLPVAEEAAGTAEFFGSRVLRHFDCGVAGLHRLMDILDDLSQASAVVVAAGMDGALPSVVGGLCPGPVIAVPTSTGYGASFGGVSALLAMLNTCSPGVVVVNIDNGFGAGYAAHVINSKRTTS